MELDSDDDYKQIDMEKMCRACMVETEEMKSVFLTDSTFGESVPRITEMLMSFTTVQVYKQ